MTLGALILVGGRSARMGADKAELMWCGRRAVDRVTDLARALGADPVLTVGPRTYGLPAVTDETPDGGPVAGLCAGLATLHARDCRRALVLAVDAPTLTPADLAPLLSASPPGAAYEGLHLPMVIAMGRAPPEASPGWALGRFIEHAGLARLACPPGTGRRLRGANTPAERDALLADLSDQCGGAG